MLATIANYTGFMLMLADVANNLDVQQFSSSVCSVHLLIVSVSLLTVQKSQLRTSEDRSTAVVLLGGLTSSGRFNTSYCFIVVLSDIFLLSLMPLVRCSSLLLLSESPPCVATCMALNTFCRFSWARNALQKMK